MPIRRSSVQSFLAILFFKILLDISYPFIIFPLFKYMGFGLDLNLFKLFESYVLLFLIFLLMPKEQKRPSHFILWLLVLVSYVPMLTVYAFKNEARIFIWAVTYFWLFVFLLFQMPQVRLPSLKESKIFRFFLIVFFSLLVFWTIYSISGITFNFDLTKVYDIRSEYTQADIPLSGYYFNWMGYVVTVAFFALFFQRKKWILAAVVFVLQLLLFSFTGNKTLLFALPFALLLMWITSRKNPLFFLAFGLFSLTGLAILSYLIIGDIWISSLFTRRLLFVPAQLAFNYFDFFSTNDPIYLSHSIFRFFLSYPYDLKPPFHIGLVYFNKPDMAANNGIVGDAFMNFGFLGLFLWAVLFALVMKLVDSCAEGKNKKIAVAAMAIPSMALVNSAFLTTLLTHGFLFATFVLYLFPKDSRVNGPDNA